MAKLILTVLGNDRPGLVDRVATAVAEHDGNWEESRMIHLADQFAGLLLVSVADQQADSLGRALEALNSANIQIVVKRSSAEPAAEPERVIALEFVGQDHPGIVQDIAHAVAEHGVSIDEFDSNTESASMAGGVLFRAHARLRVPDRVPIDQLRDDLERIADELMVDIQFDE